MQLVRDTWSAATAPPAQDIYPRTRVEVDALPYAQLGVRLGNAAPGIMGLATQTRGQNRWLSSNRMQLVTSGNRIVATLGLIKDLREVAVVGTDPFERGVANPQQLDGLSFERLLSLAPGNQLRVPAQSAVRVEAEETIDILGVSLNTLRVREDVVVPDWRWRATNLYWMSFRSPLAWRSLQHIHPDDAPIRIEVLKRAPDIA